MHEQNANMTTNSFKLLFTPMSDNDSANSRKSGLSQKTFEMFRSMQYSIGQAAADKTFDDGSEGSKKKRLITTGSVVLAAKSKSNVPSLQLDEPYLEQKIEERQ